MKLTRVLAISLLMLFSYSAMSAQKVHSKWNKKHHHVKHHRPV